MIIFACVTVGEIVLLLIVLFVLIVAYGVLPFIVILNVSRILSLIINLVSIPAVLGILKTVLVFLPLPLRTLLGIARTPAGKSLAGLAALPVSRSFSVALTVLVHRPRVSPVGVKIGDFARRVSRTAMFLAPVPLALPAVAPAAPLPLPRVAIINVRTGNNCLALLLAPST